MTEFDIYTQGQNIFLEKANIYNFPVYQNPQDYNAFFRGFFDKYGIMTTKTFLKDSLICEIVIYVHYDENIKVFLEKFINKIEEIYNIKCENNLSSITSSNKFYVTISQYNAIDFLHKLYHESDARYRNPENYSKYIKWLSNSFPINSPPSCKFLKSDPHAVIPFKNRVSDVGYDLTIIKLAKQLGKNTFMYDTGIIVAPDFGYFTKIVPRSSIVKSGYMLSNSTGIIDGTFRGSLKVVLTKVDESFPDLKLPFCCAQLIMDKHIHYDMQEVSSMEELGETSRGEGGFGSTNKKV